MIEVVYDAFVIRTDPKTPGTYKVGRKDSKGSIPLVLLSNFTSVGLAREEIDRYRNRTNEAIHASKARTTSGSK